MPKRPVAVVVVDGKQGLTAPIQSTLEWLRGSEGARACWQVNKCESPDQGLAMAADSGGSLGRTPPVSAYSRGRHRRLLDNDWLHCPPDERAERRWSRSNWQIIGPPECGKSSLLMRSACEPRAIVSTDPVANNHRDTIETRTIEREAKPETA